MANVEEVVQLLDGVLNPSTPHQGKILSHSLQIQNAYIYIDR